MGALLPSVPEEYGGLGATFAYDVRRQILGEEFAELVAKYVQFLGHPGRAVLHSDPVKIADP